MFIAVEGLDGTGKTTLAQYLAQQLDAELLRTPDASFKTIRPTLDEGLLGSPRAHTMMYAAMVQLASDKARMLNGAGRHVVIDRYWSSTIAYDSVFRRSGLPFDALSRSLMRPDLTIFLEAPLSVREARIFGRGEATAEDRRGLDARKDARLCAAYNRALRGRHVGELVRLDVSGATPLEVLRVALDHVEPALLSTARIH